MSTPDEPTRSGNPWGTPPPSSPPPASPPPAWTTPPPGYQPYPSYSSGPSGPPPSPPPRSRLPLVLGILAAVLVLALAITVPLVLSNGDDDPATSADDASDDPADPPDPAEPVDPTDLSAVQAYDDLPTTHVEGPVTYDQSPPVGGEHAAQWLDCGVYDEPVPNENVVHDLEHGTFWFAYDPAEVSADDLDTLAAKLPDNGIMSPYEGLDAPVVVTVWERQLALTGVDDARLDLFLDEYAGGETAPEPMASCAGGLTADDVSGTEAS